MPRVAKYKLYQANRVHNQKFNEKKYSVLRERIENMKPSVDNGMPEGYWRAHENNRSKRSAQVEQNTLIAKTNQKLNARLDHIAHTKSNIGKNDYYIPASKRRNPYREQRIVSVRQIYRENKLLCQRLKEIMESPGESITAAHGEHPGSCPCGQTVVTAIPIKKKEDGVKGEDKDSGASVATTTATAAAATTTTTPSAAEVKPSEVQPSESKAEEAAATSPSAVDQVKICAHCGCKVTPVDSLHEKEQKRLKQTFQIYTNGVKAELDHYQLIKQEEKKHHLMTLNKMKQRKTTTKKVADVDDGEDYGDQQQHDYNGGAAAGMEPRELVQIRAHDVDHFTSAFANFSLSFSKK